MRHATDNLLWIHGNWNSVCCNRMETVLVQYRLRIIYLAAENPIGCGIESPYRTYYYFTIGFPFNDVSLKQAIRRYNKRKLFRFV